MVETDTRIGSVSSRSRLREPTSMIERADPRTIVGWDAAVSSVQGSNIFHTAAWALVLTETYGYEPTYFVHRGSSAIEALFPVVLVHSSFTGCRGVSLPFTDFCPMLAENLHLRDRLFRGAVDYGKSHN